MTEQNATMTLGDVRTALKRAVLFTDRKGPRPVLQTVRITFGLGSVRFDAADGFKLAVQRYDAQTDTDHADASALLQRADATALLKVLPKTIASDTDEITITIDAASVNDRVHHAITISHRIADSEWADQHHTDRVPGQRYSYLGLSGSFPDVDRLIPRELDGERDSTPRIALGPEHAIAVNKAATIGRPTTAIVRWYMPADVTSPVVACIGSEFVAVIMPMFVDWGNVESETTIRYVLGEVAPDVAIVAVEADAAS